MKTPAVRRPLLLVLLCLAASACPAPAATLLVEAESFTNYGGWALDAQFILLTAPHVFPYEPTEFATHLETLD